jgi:hypothetical protein
VTTVSGKRMTTLSGAAASIRVVVSVRGVSISDLVG